LACRWWSWPPGFRTLAIPCS